MKNAQAFERFLIVKKGLQPITIRGYLGTARRFTKAVGLNPSPEQAEDYICAFYVSGFSYSYKTNTVLGVEQYMDFIGQPTRFGRQKRPRPMVKDTLTEGEVTQMLFCAKDVRQKALIALLAYSGIRNMEICNLHVRDFRASENVLRILKGKGLKDGISEITPECSRLVTEYLAAYPRSEDGYLFTTLKHGHQFTTSDVRKHVHVIARRTKIKKRVYPHLFRHSMTANMLLRGADIVSLRNQLRHTLLETTLHYCNSIIFSERNRYQKFAPSYL